MSTMKSTFVCLVILFNGVLAAAPNPLKFTDPTTSNVILESINLELVITYNTTKGEMKQSVPMYLTEQNLTVFSGSSSATSSAAVLVLEFGEMNVMNISQTFTVSKSADSFSMTELTVGIYCDDSTFPGCKAGTSTIVSLNLEKDFIKTPLGDSFACKSEVNVSSGTGENSINVTFSNVQVQPFKVKNGVFSAAQICPQDETSTIAMTTSNTAMTTSNTAMTTSKTVMTTFKTEMTTSLTAMTTRSPHILKSNFFNFTDKDGHSCILENITASFGLVTDKVKDITWFNMTVASLDKKLSHCGNKTNKTPAVLASKWGKDVVNLFVQTFAIEKDYYYLKNVSLQLKSVEKTFHVEIEDKDAFHTPLGQSLQCNSSQVIKYHDKKTNDSLTMIFSNLHLQAFDIKKSKFSSIHECPADNAISNIVPIAVGCALAVLVIIVLIAYLIGRRNSSRAGYESV